MRLKDEVFFRKESKYGGIVVTPLTSFIVNQHTLKLLTLLKEGGEVEYIANSLGVKRDDLTKVLDIFSKAGMIEGIDYSSRVSSSEQSSSCCEGSFNYLDIKLDAPLIVTLQINNECNLSCKHCFANANKEKGERLTKDEIEMLIRELAELQVMELVITGGEPLLSPNLLPLLKLCKEKGLKSALYSNGTLITQKIIDELKEVNLNKIQVSVDGLKPETHDNFRGSSGAMAKVIEGVKLLAKNGFYVIVNTVVTRDNIKEIRGLNNFLQNIGVKVHRFNRYFPIGQGKGGADSDISREDYFNYIKPLIKTDKHFKTIVSESYDIYDTIAPKRCSAGISHCSVGLYGHVVPCNYMKNNETIQLLKPDNIKEKSLKEIWDNSSLLNRIRDRSALRPCGKCERLSVCRGGCRSGALAYYNDLSKRDPFCPKFQNE